MPFRKLKFDTSARNGLLFSGTSENFIPANDRIAEASKFRRWSEYNIRRNILFNEAPIYTIDGFLFSSTMHDHIFDAPRGEKSWYERMLREKQAKILGRSYRGEMPHSPSALRALLSGEEGEKHLIVGPFSTPEAKKVAGALDEIDIGTFEWPKRMGFALLKIIEGAFLDPFPTKHEKHLRDASDQCFARSFLDASNSLPFISAVRQSVSEGHKDPDRGVRYMDLVNSSLRNCFGQKQVDEANTVSDAINSIESGAKRYLSAAKIWFDMFSDCYSMNFARTYGLSAERYAYNEHSRVLVDRAIHGEQKVPRDKSPGLLFRDTVVLPRKEAILQIPEKGLMNILQDRSGARKEFFDQKNEFMTAPGTDTAKNLASATRRYGLTICNASESERADEDFFSVFIPQSTKDQWRLITNTAVAGLAGGLVLDLATGETIFEASGGALKDVAVGAVSYLGIKACSFYLATHRESIPYVLWTDGRTQFESRGRSDLTIDPTRDDEK